MRGIIAPGGSSLIGSPLWPDCAYKPFKAHFFAEMPGPGMVRQRLQAPPTRQDRRKCGLQPARPNKRNGTGQQRNRTATMMDTTETRSYPAYAR